MSSKKTTTTIDEAENEDEAEVAEGADSTRLRWLNQPQLLAKVEELRVAVVQHHAQIDANVKEDTGQHTKTTARELRRSEDGRRATLMLTRSGPLLKL